MNYRKILLIIILIFSFSIAKSQLYSQYEEEDDDFILFQFDLGVNPLFDHKVYGKIAFSLSYEVYEKAEVGIGMSYFYAGEKGWQNNIERNLWGPKIYTNYFLGESIFVVAQYQFIYYREFNIVQMIDKWFLEKNVYAGIGYHGEALPGVDANLHLLFDFDSISKGSASFIMGLGVSVVLF